MTTALATGTESAPVALTADISTFSIPVAAIALPILTDGAFSTPTTGWTVSGPKENAFPFSGPPALTASIRPVADRAFPFPTTGRTESRAVAGFAALA